MRFFGRRRRKALVSANEGVLRDAVEDLADEHPELAAILSDALIGGASRNQLITIVNVNRQRLTAPELWEKILDYLSAAPLWEGCDKCPQSEEGVSPPGVRSEQMQRRCSGVTCVTSCDCWCSSLAAKPFPPCEKCSQCWRMGSAAMPQATLETLACGVASKSYPEPGTEARMPSPHPLLISIRCSDSVWVRKCRERSALLSALSGLGAGAVSDLEVDDWLRDAAQADPDVRRLAGAPSGEDDAALSGTRSNLDRVRTAAGEMTFYRLGETVSISEDQERVAAGIRTLVAGEIAAQEMWRRRIPLRAPPRLGASKLPSPGLRQCATHLI